MSLQARYFTVETQFNPQQFEKALTTTAIGRFLLYRHSVDSTQDLIQREASEGAPTGTVALAEIQTKGRGRANRPWSSGPKGNIYMTVLLRPKSPMELPKANLAGAIAVAKAAQAVGTRRVNARVKWPNDVWVGAKKLCGVLTDTTFMGNIITAAIGIGINVNQKMTEDPDELVRSSAISLRDALNQDALISRELVLANVCNNLEQLIQLEMPELLAEYKKYDMLVGNPVVVMPKKREDPTRVNAKAVGFDEDGFLIVELEDGTRKTLVAEEVSIRPVQ